MYFRNLLYTVVLLPNIGCPNCNTLTNHAFAILCLEFKCINYYVELQIGFTMGMKNKS